MQSKAATVEQYLAELPEDRRTALQAVREVILKNLDKDYEEGMQYGMIGYFVPHRVYPAGYHVDPRQPLPFACLASQKNYMSLYLGTVYGENSDLGWFTEQWAKSGKKLDMGKSCIRFKSLDDIPLDVIGEAVHRTPAYQFIAHYESVLKDYLKATRGASKSDAKPTGKTAPASAKAATAGTKATTTVKSSTTKPAKQTQPAKTKAAPARKPVPAKQSATVQKAVKKTVKKVTAKPVAAKKGTKKTIQKKVVKKVAKVVKKKSAKR